jgi:hypothetical protein
LELYLDTYNVLKKPPCKKFVEAVLNKVAAQTNKALKSTDIMGLFGIIFGQRGFVHGKTWQGTAEAEGSIGGEMRASDLYREHLLVPHHKVHLLLDSWVYMN